MAVPTTGPYYILLAGRGTGQTARLFYGGPPSSSGFAGESTGTLGPYSTLTAAESKLQSLTITGDVTVVKSSDNSVLGSVNVANKSTSASAAPNGGSEPSDPSLAAGQENQIKLPNPFSSIENALSAIYDALTNGKMWRSLGWLLLGVLLIFVGLFLWVGKDGTPLGLAAKFAK